ncbi:MAG: MFS transporter [Chloroflexi bacterium]|nr:MFS transporter [Chloroflexota bacterium]
MIDRLRKTLRFLGSLGWSVAPPNATRTQRHNFLNAQLEGLGVGLAMSAGPFISVLLTRLGATSTQVGLLSSLPGVAGIGLAIVAGRFLQARRNIVPWFSRLRLIALSAYTFTGLAPFFVPERYLVTSILVIWALAAIPQTFMSVAFSLVMNGIAGPKGRYDLMSRRWSILGVTQAVMIALAGWVLDQISFPLNYQLVFLVLSLGGVISFSFSRRIELPDQDPPRHTHGAGIRHAFTSTLGLVRAHPEFISFVSRRLVYLAGGLLGTPLFTLYFVRVLGASDSWIGAINTANTAVLLIGYSIWARQARTRGSRFVLFWTTLGLALYPVAVAVTRWTPAIVLYAALAGVFSAGINLVFFDLLMRTVPEDQNATFVAIDQSLQYIITVLMPIIGTILADQIGIAGALLVSGGLRLIGWALMVRYDPGPSKP